ncbi:MAG: ABC transporter permease subunit [Deltaproteobacteria bacterium]|nr:ABC transporter permease subunit [Deltaproteobacteria bacterium]
MKLNSLYHTARIFIGSSALLVIWYFAEELFPALIIPSFAETVTAAYFLLLDSNNLQAIAMTIAHIILGLFITGLIGGILGLRAGLSSAIHDYCLATMLVAQVTPIIIWMTVFIVWTANTSFVTLLVLILSILPLFYFAVYHGVRNINPGLFQMAKVYRIPKALVISKIIFAAVREQLIMSLSVSIGVAWKVAITAEFVAAGGGIGAALYWSYRNLNIVQLFAWTLIVIAISLISELLIIKPLKVYSSHLQYAVRN